MLSIGFALQGLKGLRSPHPINDGLASDTWYQVSAISERAEGVFCEPVYAVVKTHREPARVMEMAAKPVKGSTDSLVLLVRLDCSSAPTDEACGLLRYVWGHIRRQKGEHQTCAGNETSSTCSSLAVWVQKGPENTTTRTRYLSAPCIRRENVRAIGSHRRCSRTIT